MLIKRKKNNFVQDQDEDEISEDPRYKNRRFSLRRKITEKKDITSLWNLIMSNSDIKEMQGLVKDLEFLMDFGRINFTEFIQEEVKWVRMDINITLAKYDEQKGLLIPQVQKKSLDEVEEDRFKDQLKGRVIYVIYNVNLKW
jgi:hypothetical protein